MIRLVQASKPNRCGVAEKIAGFAIAAGIGLTVGGTTLAYAQVSDARQACKADYQSFCSGVQPGGGRIIACLKRNAEKLSPGCQHALASAKTGG